MKSSAALQRKQQRLKLIVIPVLVVILAAVLFWPAADEAAPAAARAATARAATAAKQPAATIATVSAAAVVFPTATPTPPAAARWPEVQLHEITAVNPFAKPVEKVEVIAEPDVAPAPAASVGSWLQLATDLAALAQRQGGPNPANRPANSSANGLGTAAAAVPNPSGQSAAIDSTTATADPGDAESLATALDYATVGRLSAILHSESGRCALLNGNQIVHEGDQVPGGFRVVQITGDKIWVRPLGE